VKRLFLALLGLGIGLVCVHSVFGQIVINEFTIEPDQSVELWNSSPDTVNLENWVLDDSGGATFYTLPPNSNILPQSCLVFTSNFNLNRTTPDMLRLFNPDHLAVDSYAYTQSPGLNQSWQRVPDGGELWQSGGSTLSQSNTTGESCLRLADPTPTASLTPTTASDPTPTSTNSPSSSPTPPLTRGIYLNEALVNPDNEAEWIEIYNHNDYTVELTNWYYDDGQDAGATPKPFSLSLPGKSYQVVEMTSAIFNNDQDSVRLLTAQKIEVDSFEYCDSQKGESYSRQTTDESVWCKTTPSKGTVNNSCLESPSTIVLGAFDPTPTTTSRLANQPSSAVLLTPKNFTFKSVFYPLKVPKSKVLGIKTDLKEAKKQLEIKRAINVSWGFLMVNFGLNCSLILYIICYYYGQKTKVFFPT